MQLVHEIAQFHDSIGNLFACVSAIVWQRNRNVTELYVQMA